MAPRLAGARPGSTTALRGALRPGQRTRHDPLNWHLLPDDEPIGSGARTLIFRPPCEP